MHMKDTRSLILQSAFGLFLSNGYQATSMSQLVAATKLSKGAFYHHFKSKEEIYASVINTYFLEYFRTVDWETTKSLTLQEMLALMQQYYQQFLPQISQLTEGVTSRYFIMFFEAFHQVPAFKNEVQAFYQQLKDILQEKIAGEKSINMADASVEAVRYIAQFEGMMFWSAIFPDDTA